MHKQNRFPRVFSNRKHLSKIRALIPVPRQAHISKIWILGVDGQGFYFARYCLWERWAAPMPVTGCAAGTHPCDTAISSLGVTSNRLTVQGLHFEIPPSISLPHLGEVKWLPPTGSSEETSTSLCNFGPVLIKSPSEGFASHGSPRAE